MCSRGPNQIVKIVVAFNLNSMLCVPEARPHDVRAVAIRSIESSLCVLGACPDCQDSYCSTSTVSAVSPGPVSIVKTVVF